MSVEEPKIEEITENQETNEQAEVSQQEIPEGAQVRIISKNEKKARAAILKLDLKKVKGISRVTFRKKGNYILAISAPEVYRTPAGSYVVFGEAEVEDLNKRYAETAAAQQAAQQAAQSAGQSVDAEGTPSKDPASITADLEASANAPNKEDDDDDEEVDATGVDSADIDIVVEQTGVSRNKAIKALKTHNGDMVNAIMSLSS
ncbi:Nascent polypeptide-associated complex subunit alpha [Komagataella phaffii CBS 7435]|uniref:Nascent polypeptide-associated complex subunit alpha n=2 Tax=Komagataella phaffii TaxID=460519 RepID=C4R1N4_KOMPG|nr:Alpha subunit of the heteromeric nascent polypeptide-associated complex (NAC) [Komagataella phaffii GS115]AOA62979.1 GQ67_00824T0 [Komagataella phaffii]CAH2448059.1 Nascent polypeptide-associated complex subunit alpha [Komagataella phaffii CBS 7435]AOA67872.1 GQ68_00565T0 [Komagataella phaffii GS115]CAY69408.1 Alpha subunit of the heteromeric nascent polypeptide-associated complex (NAC) [Komagataella phaffii GS115]CCA38206.1 Nascent polypeptide-associated complex subunit alpha [Komagataella